VNRNSMWASMLTIVLVSVIAVVAMGLGARPKLGLDLQGGISAIYTPVFEDGEPDNIDEVLAQTITIIRQRVDSLGVAEPEISRLGTDIQVQLPGITDADRANEIIGRTAQLGFYPVARQLLPGSPEYNETPPCIVQTDDPGLDEWVFSPERPSPDDGVVCGAELLPGITQEDLDNFEGSATEAPSGEPTVVPTATPSDTATESARMPGTPAEPMVRAAQEDASEAPAPGATATPAPSPGATPTTVEDFDFGDGLPLDAPRPYKYVVDPPPTADGDELTGSDIVSATPGLVGQSYGVTLEFDEDGTEAFRVGTSEAACDRDDPDNGRPGLLAIVLDDLVESAPTMAEGVICGEGLSSGATITTGSAESAEDLAVVLSAGALPVTLEPTTFTTVSPTLGTSSLQSGLVAGLVGLLLVALYLVWFYRGLGFIAIGGLVIFGALVLGAITAMGRFGFALTLAGVAGIIVAIGITADSSIIYFERIRDEVAVGKTTRLAVFRGFDSAFRTNLAGNTVTLVAAVILYTLAVGPVRGFAFTLGLATLLDLVIMWAWTRAAVGLLVDRGRLGPSIRRRQAGNVPAPVTSTGGRR
jgi:preprotein translocase subunit SecD